MPPRPSERRIAAQAVTRGTFCLYERAVEAENISGGGEGYGEGVSMGQEVMLSGCDACKRDITEAKPRPFCKN